MAYIQRIPVRLQPNVFGTMFINDELLAGYLTLTLVLDEVALNYMKAI